VSPYRRDGGTVRHFRASGILLGVSHNTQQDVSRFVGGASGPTKGGSRLHASWPLAVLTIGSGRLTLSGRGPLRRFFRETVADPAQVSAEPIVGPFMDGVVITVTKDERWLFWTRKRSTVLDLLAEQGATVTREERAVRWSDMMG
jgi:hypothetical protein